jgi:hypothetical protein
MNDEDEIAFYRGIQSNWKFYYKLWYYIHYALGTMAVLFSTLVAAKPMQSELPNGTYDVLAWALALVTGMLAFLSPEERGNRYFRAWLLLSTIINKHDIDDYTTPQDVMAVHEFGERIIHNESGSRDTTPPTSLPPTAPRPASPVAASPRTSSRRRRPN